MITDIPLALPVADLTIVTVFKNNLHGLQQTCKSFADNSSFNSFQKVTFLFIDGYSTDDSYEFILSWKNTVSKYLKVEIFRSPPNGVYHAMNYAISVCSSKWLIFINSGDLLLSPVDKLIAIIDECPPFITHITGNCGLFFKTLAENIYYNSKVPTIKAHQATMYRADLHQNYSFYNEKFCVSADSKFLNSLPKNAAKNINLLISATLVSPENLSRNPRYLKIDFFADKSIRRSFISRVFFELKLLVYCLESQFNYSFSTRLLVQLHILKGDYRLASKSLKS